MLRLPDLGRGGGGRGGGGLVLVLFMRLFYLRLFGFVCFLFLPLGVWEGLRLVIVALPRLSFAFFKDTTDT